MPVKPLRLCDAHSLHRAAAARGGGRLFVETALPLLVVLGGTDVNVSGGYR